MRKSRHLLIGSVCLLSAACTTSGGGPLGLVMFDKNQHVSGAGSLFAPDEQQCITASFLLSALAKATADEGEPVPCQRLRVRLQHALGIRDLFSSMTDVQKAEEKQRRNQAIGALIAASNHKCGQYVQFLQQYQGNVRSTTGIISQAAAILATVSSGGTAQGFAATSGIIGGAGNTLHQAHFQNQTVAMLTKAFDTRRLEMLKKMDGLMQCTPEQYPFARAFADVQNYHAACSIVVGLEEAQEAVEEKNSPSLDTYMKLLEKLPAMQKAIDAVSKRSTGTTDDQGGNGNGNGTGNGNGGGVDNGSGAGDGANGNGGQSGNVAPDPQTGSDDGGNENGTDKGTNDAAPSCPFTSNRQSDPTIGLSAG